MRIASSTQQSRTLRHPRSLKKKPASQSSLAMKKEKDDDKFPDHLINSKFGHSPWPKVPGHPVVTIGIAFTAEVSACSEDVVDLAGYVIWALIRRKGVLWDLDRGSEKASPVFEHLFRQTTSVQASMREWCNYPAGKDTGLPRNIAIELGVQHCPECPHPSQSSCFQSQELTDPGQTTRNIPTPLGFHHPT
ncbi:hypothetical protein TNCV_3869041 [Trichonephila clavipes]|nr:hypothetical protein TNCV_3869041 [Trichonephila clavipes]